MIALKGTTVDVVANGNKPLSGGQIVFKDGKNIPLKLSSTNPKQVMASVVIDRKTTFQVELTDSSRQTYRGLEEYNMEALEDQKPIIKFTKPGRDVPATNLEEVLTEVRAEDDFGVSTLDIYYSVNGKAEKKIEVFKNSGRPARHFRCSYIFHGRVRREARRFCVVLRESHRYEESCEYRNQRHVLHRGSAVRHANLRRARRVGSAAVAEAAAASEDSRTIPRRPW